MEENDSRDSRDSYESMFRVMMCTEDKFRRHFPSDPSKSIDSGMESDRRTLNRFCFNNIKNEETQLQIHRIFSESDIELYTKIRLIVLCRFRHDNLPIYQQPTPEDIERTSEFIVCEKSDVNHLLLNSADHLF